MLVPTIKVFMAYHQPIQNTVGPEGLQAVALMSRSSFSLVYPCSIEGYQDTLDAGVSGESSTVNFVFGNARAIFVGCRLLVHSSILGASKPNVVIT